TPNIPEFEKLGLSVKGLVTNNYIDETLGEVDLNHANLRKKNLGKLCLFNWDQVSMEYEPLFNKYRNLLDFLRDKYGNHWTDIAVIKKQKINNKIIIYNRVLNGKNISLKLIENKCKVELQIDDGQSIDLIFREEADKRNVYQKNVYQKFVYNGSNFEGAKLCSANLFGSELSACIMTKAELIQTILENCKLNGAYMVEADIRLANLRKSELNGANLSSTVLSGADLTGAQLNGANLNEAILGFTDSNGITMDGFKLPGKNALYKNNLKGANLHNAQLNGASLENTKLMGVDLSNATLTGANLKGADLRGADLRGTDFSGSNLESTDFRDTKQDKNTNFSGSSHPPTILEVDA
ncbi:MAG: pentapeptide repeat-containing protein, partial [Lutibacter sp.]